MSTLRDLSKRRSLIAEYVSENPLADIGEVANKFDVSLATVRNACHENGVPPPSTGAKLASQARVCRIISLVATGHTYEDTAKAEGVTRAFVGQLVRQCQINGFDPITQSVYQET